MWIWVLGALLLLIIGIALIPVRMELLLQMHNLHVTLKITVRGAIFQGHRDVHISKLAMTALEHMLKRWRDKGEPVKEPLQETVAHAKRVSIREKMEPPLRYLAARTACPHLSFEADIGGGDAMESALLSGLAWSLVGTGIGLVSSYLRVAPDSPSVQIWPNYEQPSLRIRSRCILLFRLGQAIWAVLWLVGRMVWDRETRAWIRDSLRRKGENEDVRASDPGPHEDGHGEPEDYD